jgi:ribosome-dependent ATPase
LGFADLGVDLLALIVFVPVLTWFSILLLRKQER